MRNQKQLLANISKGQQKQLLASETLTPIVANSTPAYFDQEKHYSDSITQVYSRPPVSANYDHLANVPMEIVLHHQQPHSHAANQTLNGDGHELLLVRRITSHEKQMAAFMYTSAILCFYALIILFFMLKQICRQEKEEWEYSENGFVRCRRHSGPFCGKSPLRRLSLRERQRKRPMTQFQVKQQLCNHIAKMGAFTDTIIVAACDGNTSNAHLSLSPAATVNGSEHRMPGFSLNEIGRQEAVISLTPSPSPSRLLEIPRIRKTSDNHSCACFDFYDVDDEYCSESTTNISSAFDCSLGMNHSPSSTESVYSNANGACRKQSSSSNPSNFWLSPERSFNRLQPVVYKSAEFPPRIKRKAQSASGTNHPSLRSSPSTLSASNATMLSLGKTAQTAYEVQPLLQSDNENSNESFRQLNGHHCQKSQSTSNVRRVATSTAIAPLHYHALNKRLLNSATFSCKRTATPTSNKWKLKRAKTSDDSATTNVILHSNNRIYPPEITAERAAQFLSMDETTI